MAAPFLLYCWPYIIEPEIALDLIPRLFPSLPQDKTAASAFITSQFTSCSTDYPMHMAKSLSRIVRDRTIVGVSAHNVTLFCCFFLVLDPMPFLSVTRGAASHFVPSLIIHCRRQLCDISEDLPDREDVMYIISITLHGLAYVAALCRLLLYS